jgi:hypothetical protein
VVVRRKDDSVPEVKCMSNTPEWSDCNSLEDWVIKMIKEKKTDSPEFQAALKYFGRARFEAIWRKHRAKKGSK